MSYGHRLAASRRLIFRLGLGAQMNSNLP